MEVTNETRPQEHIRAKDNRLKRSNVFLQPSRKCMQNILLSPEHGRETLERNQNYRAGVWEKEIYYRLQKNNKTGDNVLNMNYVPFFITLFVVTGTFILNAKGKINHFQQMTINLLALILQF